MRVDWERGDGLFHLVNAVSIHELRTSNLLKLTPNGKQNTAERKQWNLRSDPGRYLQKCFYVVITSTNLKNETHKPVETQSPWIFSNTVNKTLSQETEKTCFLFCITPQVQRGYLYQKGFPTGWISAAGRLAAAGLLSEGASLAKNKEPLRTIVQNLYFAKMHDFVLHKIPKSSQNSGVGVIPAFFPGEALALAFASAASFFFGEALAFDFDLHFAFAFGPVPFFGKAVNESSPLGFFWMGFAGSKSESVNSLIGCSTMLTDANSIEKDCTSLTLLSLDLKQKCQNVSAMHTESLKELPAHSPGKKKTHLLTPNNRAIRRYIAGTAG